jgi:hypothetical protein
MKRDDRIRRKMRMRHGHDEERELPRHPLARYARALQLLRDDLQRSLYMETSDGLGHYAAQTYNGIHEAIMAKFADPFIVALKLGDMPDADDRQIVSLVNLLSGQLLNFIEAEIEDDLEAQDEKDEDVTEEDSDD